MILGPHLLSTAVTIATLAVASWYDLRSREIPEYIWVPAFVVSIAVALSTGTSVLIIVLSLIPALILLILTLLGMIGGADFIAILLVGISTPYLNILPVSFVTLLYSALIPSLLTVYNIIVNVARPRYRSVFKNLKCRPRTKLLLMFLGKPMAVSRYLKSRFNYPLTLISCSDGAEVVCRTSFKVDEDYREHISRLAECLSKGYVRLDDHIVVTPALPHVVFITVGYVLALLTPREVIYTVFSLLVRLYG